MNLTVFDDIQLLAFFLAFSRWLGIVLNMPIFDNTSVPVTAKILSAMLISYVFFPVVETVLTNEILSVGKRQYLALN
jgi:flagellar biosynthesis protein FliR